MKRLLIIVYTLILLHATCAQQVSISTHIQKTIMGVQNGASVRVQSTKGWGLGVMHQSSLSALNEGVGETYPLNALELIVPIASCGNMRFFLTPKAGLVNNMFFVIIPEVESQIRVTKHISLGIMAGMRMRESSSGVKLTYNF